MTKELSLIPKGRWHKLTADRSNCIPKWSPCFITRRIFHNVQSNHRVSLLIRVL